MAVDEQFVIAEQKEPQAGTMSIARVATMAITDARRLSRVRIA